MTSFELIELREWDFALRTSPGVGSVNGLRVVAIELKKPGVLTRCFRREPDALPTADPGAFWFKALLIASNGTNNRVGSLTADGERCFELRTR